MKKFAINKEVSPEILKTLSILNRVSEYIGEYFQTKDYGKGVEEIYIIVNCVNPKLSNKTTDFETGVVINKKYIKSAKSLEFDIKLNYSETLKASENEVMDIFARGVLKSYSEIAALEVKDFNINEFYEDLRNILQNRAWLFESYQPKLFHYQSPTLARTEFLPGEIMPHDAFWMLVEKARVESGAHIDEQIKILIDVLSKREDKEIIGFECTLRELLTMANHYNVMAVQKIVEGQVTDDSFLYFRCKLILYGRITFDKAINTPNHLIENIDPLANGEALLSVADSAFSLKYGDTEKMFPRDYASKVIDYNFGIFPVQGNDWAESDLPKRFSKLWKAYRKM